jgi:hypothetical protein
MSQGRVSKARDYIILKLTLALTLTPTLIVTQTRQDKTRLDKTKLDKTRLDKTRQDNKRQDKTRQDKTRQDETRQGKTKQGETKQDKTKKGETRQGANLEPILPKSSTHHIPSEPLGVMLQRVNGLI